VVISIIVTTHTAFAQAPSNRQKTLEICAQAGALVETVLENSDKQHVVPWEEEEGRQMAKSEVWNHILHDAWHRRKNGQSPRSIGSQVADGCMAG
jgi:hypothetical protein